MKLSHVRKKHIYTEQGIETVVATYLGWNCEIEAQENEQFKVTISAYNLDENGECTSGCLAGSMVRLQSVAELKELVSYYLDRVELSCAELLELAEEYGEEQGEVVALEELLDFADF